jgi:hypothetical protein
LWINFRFRGIAETLPGETIKLRRKGGERRETVEGDYDQIAKTGYVSGPIYM